MKKYIFVTGGVCSSLGKGISASSLGYLLESRGFTIRMIKIDPYINVDAGTMSPYQHGEVYVTDDGAETDLDLGNYARFTRSALARENSITTGQVYLEVIQAEREGRYLGKTVQVIPHITDRIKKRILAVGEVADVDITIIEVGGTVGDIESIPFLEAARQLMMELGREQVISVHVTLIPEVSQGELKTKPTQHSVNKMREIGIQPNILLCRAPVALDSEMRRKIALFTNVPYEAVISAPDTQHSIYEVPLLLGEQGMDEIVLKNLGMTVNPILNRDHWVNMVETLVHAKKTIRIGMVGKYIDLNDSYKSVDEALVHGGIPNGVLVKVEKIDSEKLEKMSEGDVDAILGSVDGILVPGGFGARGVKGMIIAANWAREHKKPYFGICLGMQIMVIEYARSILGLEDADSTEFRPDTANPVVSLLEEQIDVKNYGGTMRLGAMDSYLKPQSRIREIYGSEKISERHRHRYEVANQYREKLEKAGLIVGATTPQGELVESVTWPDHPWGIGVQYHPEFKSAPLRPHPLFASFIAASNDASKA